MPKPRVRITTGNLLLLIAVLAADFGALRFLVERDRDWRRADSIAPLLADALFSLLPVVNIAFIGAAIHASKWIRSSRRGGESVSPPALTYFCIHLLALGFLFGVFMPGPFEDYRGITIDPTSNFAILNGPDSLRYTDGFPSIALDATLVAVFCSGPILILAGLGRLLARRYAAKVSRRRFRLMAALVSTGFAAAALAIVVAPQPFGRDDGAVVLSFRIIDQDSNQPIRSAFVRLTDPFEPDALPPRALTDADGRVQLAARLPIDGKSNVLRTMGVVYTWGRWLEVSAPGYRAVCLALPEVLTPSIDVETPVTGQVVLAKGQTPGPVFRDVAGSYLMPNGFTSTSVEIGPDGRFAWEWSGCTGHIREYGRLKRVGEEIELVALAHPGREVEHEMALRYRTIPWRDQLYLSSTEQADLQRFCRAALAPLYPRYLRNPHLPAREAPLVTPQVGPPRLPAMVWVRFALGEVDLRNEDSGLRLALQSLIP
jgi:hypothetical protein